MYKRQRNVKISCEPRMFSIEEAVSYMGMGRASTKAFCEEVGALRKIGGRVLVDRHILDAALDKLGEEV